MLRHYKHTLSEVALVVLLQGNDLLGEPHTTSNGLKHIQLDLCYIWNGHTTCFLCIITRLKHKRRQAVCNNPLIVRHFDVESL